MFLDLFFNISFFLNRYFKIRLLALFFLNLINTLLDIISISAVPAIIIFFLKKNEVSVEINYISELLNYFLHFTENIPFSIIFLLVLSFFLLKTILNIIYFYNYTKYGFDLEIKISKELVRRKLGDDYLDYTKNTYSSFLNLMTTIITEFI